VYLETSVRQQLARTRRDRKRPLLRAGDRETVLSALLAVRDPLYREVADLAVRTDGRGARSVVREILEFLGVRDG
ncbi:MAG TPA: shikimate kinase, partial [Pseudomonadales bacterium]|nr:shikimate kinase [Pseudomonadales bacterium]